MVRITGLEKYTNLFGDWKETLIWSCLQGVMGTVYADNYENPKTAIAYNGDFAFIAGMPNAEFLNKFKKEFSREFLIVVPQNDDLSKLIKSVYCDKAKKVIRYATKKEKDIFDKAKLKKIISSLSEEYELKMIDENIFNLCRTNRWSLDLVSQYKDYEAYSKLGIGVVIMKNGEILSGASSYSSYNGGIEIEIDTREDCRRKGFAYVCGAKLILECLKRNIYPSWDAQNLHSLALAEKLGYHFDYEYIAYEITLN